MPRDGILYFNIENKVLPFKGKFRYECKTDKVDTILQQVKKMPCKTAVIDDAGYIMTHHFMRNHRNKRGNASFEMYDDIADSMYNLVRAIKEDVEDDKIVYIIMHEDVDEYGNTCLLTLGKLLDKKCNLAGMVTIALRAISEDGKHFFRTATDGMDIVKTPMGMFDKDEIDNDLKIVDEAIREYYELKETKKNETV